MTFGGLCFKEGGGLQQRLAERAGSPERPHWTGQGWGKAPPPGQRRAQSWMLQDFTLNYLGRDSHFDCSCMRTSQLRREHMRLSRSQRTPCGCSEAGMGFVPAATTQLASDSGRYRQRSVRAWARPKIPCMQCGSWMHGRKTIGLIPWA